MSEPSNDILEITAVYGTQAGFLKDKESAFATPALSLGVRDPVGTQLVFLKEEEPDFDTGVVFLREEDYAVGLQSVLLREETPSDNTQTAFLKEEPAVDIPEICLRKDEPAIIIKNENDEEDFEEDIIINSDKIRYDLQCNLMVYTTKLDRMNVLKKIEDYTSKTATEMIIAESKPRYEQTPERTTLQQLHNDSNFIASYIELCRRVQQFNTKVRTEANAIHLRNKELIKMCKPLKIVLEDIKSNQNLLQTMTKQTTVMAIEDHSDDDEPTVYYNNDVAHANSDEDMPLSKSKSYTLCVNKKSKKSEALLTTVVIKDKRSQEADIYILDASKGLKTYLRTNVDQCDILQKLHASKRTVLLEHCCWVNREKRIKNFIQTGFACENVSNFMRKPHSCLPKQCTCCCIYGPSMPKNPSLSIYISKPVNKQTVTEASRSTNNLIKRASTYIAMVPKVLGETDDADFEDSESYLKCAVIIIKYHRIMFAQTELLGENYEIDNKGEIKTYVIPTVNRSITEEKNLYKKTERMCNIPKKYFSYLICCWHMRKDTIVRLRDSNQLSPSAFRFIQTSHLCRTDKCECCCKPTKTGFVLKSVRINLMYNKEHINNRAKNNSTVSNSNIKENVESHEYKNKKINSNSCTRKSNKPSAFSKTNISEIKPNSVKQTVQDLIDLTIGTTAHHNPENPIHCDSLQNNMIDPSSPSLLNGILDRFKDLKLAVNGCGKLTAIINTQPDQLTPVEIKILSDVLTVAAEQIKQLGIAPEDFCERVNNRVKNVPSNPEMPPLVPIHPSPTANEATTKTIGSRKSETRSSKLPNMVQPFLHHDPNGCKTRSIDITFPTTQNRSTISEVYQLMSSLGGLKNQHLMFAYKTHFKEKIEGFNFLSDDNIIRPIATQHSKNYSPTPIIGKICSSADNMHGSETPRTNAPVLKRKITHKQPKVPIKKLRVEGPRKRIAKNPKPPQYVLVKKSDFIALQNANGNVSNPLIGSDQPPLLVTNNIISMPKASHTDIAQSVVLTDETPIFIDDSNLSPAMQYASGSDNRHPGKSNDYDQNPLFLSNNNFISMQDANGTDIAQPVIGVDQTPLFVSNDNFLNQTPLFLSNDNIIIMHNDSGLDVEQHTIGDVKTPLCFSNSNFIPVQIASSPNIVQPAKGGPQFVSNSNFKPMQNIDTVVVQPIMADVNPPLFVSNSDFKLTQNVNCDVTPDISAMPKMPVQPKPVNSYPRLYHMLTQDSQVPTLAPTSARPRETEEAVTPLILAHSKGLLKKGRRRTQKGPNKSQAKEKANAVIETTLKTNVIPMLGPDDGAFAQAELIDPLLDDVEEEESIFGV